MWREHLHILPSGFYIGFVLGDGGTGKLAREPKE